MQQDSSTHPELVFGLVGPIGVNMDSVQNALQEALRQVHYEPEVIHLTKLLSEYSAEDAKSPVTTEYERKIDQANRLCKTAGHGGALAAMAIMAIQKARRKKNERNGTVEDDLDLPAPATAYIVRQLKRKEEVTLLRSVYGDLFVQISVSLDKDARVSNLSTKIAKDSPLLSRSECEKKARELIQIDDHQDGTDFGQQLGDIFHLADFFVTGRENKRLRDKILSFIKAFFGDNSMSPSKDEFGSYMAASAALRSIDLSRQVGSAILSPDGDIISLGCNEVPKAGGGNYWIDDEGLARDFEKGAEQNSIEKRRIVADLIDRFANIDSIAESEKKLLESIKGKLEVAASDALISDITEYGRMTHAEMCAICDAARLGRQVGGSTMYVTTFPCHNCAKHIVASGIRRCVYIEPYPKSRAVTSHEDAISEDVSASGKVVFEHFEGISPNRYRDIFQKGRRRNGTEVLNWYEGEPRPRVRNRPVNYSAAEYVTSGTILEKLSDIGRPSNED